MKRHQRLNEILIFLPALHLGNQQNCLQEETLSCYKPVKLEAKKIKISLSLSPCTCPALQNPTHTPRMCLKVFNFIFSFYISIYSTISPSCLNLDNLELTSDLLWQKSVTKCLFCSLTCSVHCHYQSKVHCYHFFISIKLFPLLNKAYVLSRHCLYWCFTKLSIFQINWNWVQIWLDGVNLCVRI